MDNLLQQTINQQLEKFKNAIEPHKFVYDGIVSIDDYLKAPIKILWILKEPNSDENSLTDFREHIKTLRQENNIWDGWAPTFNPISYSVYGILNNKLMKDIPCINGNAEEILKEMKSIAFINVKKFAGGSVAKNNVIDEFYQSYKELLHEQIKLINPDVLIFGNTFDFFDKNFFLSFGMEEKIKKEMSISVYKYGAKLFISTYHPNQRKIIHDTYCNSIIKSVQDYL